jgi:hypothetical protein
LVLVSASATGVCLLAFSLLSFGFWEFVLDDAYINYRYASNLALHGQLTWNLDEVPVEGFTALLWVMLNALAIWLGLSPVVFSKAISIIAVGAMLFALIAVTRALRTSERLIVVAAIALSVPLALHAVQGMETAFAAVLLFFASLFAIQCVEAPSVRHSALWFAFAFVASLARPESAIFAMLASCVIFLIHAAEKNRRALRLFLLPAAPFVILGIAYMLVRFWYFGHWLPNTFYVKKSSSVVSLEGAGSALGFWKAMLSPYVLLVLWTSVNRPACWRDLRPLVPVATGIFGILCFLTTVVPIQGYLHRFTIVVYPSLILLVAYLLVRSSREDPLFRNRGVRTASVAFFILWPLSLLPTALEEVSLRWQDDRVLAGRALVGIHGTMFVTESGALPYFSGWKSADDLGLTSEEIAHRGLSESFLEIFNPDMIVLSIDTVFEPSRRPIVSDFLMKNDYVAVAAIVKTKKPLLGKTRGHPQRHLYFARRSSPLYGPITEKLTRIPGVRYADLRAVMAFSERAQPRQTRR